MRTTTKLLGEITHGYHSYILAVFLTEKSHRSCLLGGLYIHHLSNNRKICLDLFVYQSFYLLDLLSGHRLEMGKVKTQSVRSYQRPLLLYMRTENRFQGFLEQMGRAVVFAGIGAGCFIYRKE